MSQVLLDKNTPQIRTVVNKVGTIENVFRTFPMEVLEPHTHTHTHTHTHAYTQTDRTLY